MFTKKTNIVSISVAAFVAATNAIELEGERRGDVTYDHTGPDNAIASNSECSAAELDFVDRSLAAAVEAIEYSLANENTPLFKKWFGESTGESDDDVRSRMSDATWQMR